MVTKEISRLEDALQKARGAGIVTQITSLHGDMEVVRAADMALAYLEGDALLAHTACRGKCRRCNAAMIGQQRGSTAN